MFFKKTSEKISGYLSWTVGKCQKVFIPQYQYKYQYNTNTSNFEKLHNDFTDSKVKDTSILSHMKWK